MKRFVTLLVTLLLALGFSLSTSVHAASSTYTVTDCSTSSLSDTSAGGFGWAVNQANADTSNPTITFSCAQTVTPNVITIPSTVTLTKSMTIDGSGQNIAFDGGNTVTMFFFNATITVQMDSLTFQQGRLSIEQYNGTLSLWNTRFQGNFLGVATVGTATMQTTILASTFTGNTGTNGAAIQTGVNTTLLVGESTFANNSASSLGGALWVNGSTQVDATTFTGNTASSGGNDIWANGLTVVTDSIMPDANTGTVSASGTLTSATFASPISQSIAGVQQTVYPLTDYTVAGAKVALSSMTAVAPGVSALNLDQVGNVRPNTTAVGAYEPNGMTAQQTSTQNQVLVINPGNLSETMQPLSPITVTTNGFDQTVTGTLPVAVSDARGSGQGWHLTVQRTVFTNRTTPQPTITLSIIGISAQCAIGSTCTLPFHQITGYSFDVSTTLPLLYADAGIDTGMANMQVAGSFAILVPSNIPIGTYTSVVTVAVIAGP